MLLREPGEEICDLIKVAGDGGDSMIIIHNFFKQTDDAGVWYLVQKLF